MQRGLVTRKLSISV